MSKVRCSKCGKEIELENAAAMVVRIPSPRFGLGVVDLHHYFLCRDCRKELLDSLSEISEEEVDDDAYEFLFDY